VFVQISFLLLVGPLLQLVLVFRVAVLDGKEILEGKSLKDEVEEGNVSVVSTTVLCTFT